MDLEKLGKEVKDARAGRGMTQPDLVRALAGLGVEVTFQRIGQIENASSHDVTRRPRQPSFDLVAALAEALGAPRQEWLDLAGYPVGGEELTPERVIESDILFVDGFYKTLTGPQLEKMSRIVNRERERRAGGKNGKKPPKSPPE